jgi:hypothetical protein
VINYRFAGKQKKSQSDRKKSKNFNACDNVKREKDFKKRKKVKRFNNLNISKVNFCLKTTFPSPKERKNFKANKRFFLSLIKN